MIRAVKIVAASSSALLIVAASWVQNPPSTDIWIVEIREDGDGLEVTGTPRNVTARPGYDNQPAFTGDGSWLLYTSQRDGQSDIWAFQLDAEQDLQIIATPESEYSPTPIPGVPRFSVVRVEEDGAQRLWSFPYPVELGGTIGMGPADPYPSNAPVPTTSAALFLEDIAAVGYHAWVDPEVMLFVLGDPPTLQRARLGDRTGEVVARDIGRSLHPIRGRRAVSFVDKSVEPWMIRAYDLDARQVTELAEIFGDGEDYGWTPGGLLVMGGGGELAVRRPGAGDDWRVVADLSGHGVTAITRLAVSPLGTHLALVAAES